MKEISLKQELAIMANMRGLNAPKRYSLKGFHYSSLKTAISQAKKIVTFGGGIMRVDITTTTPAARRVTRVTVINHGWEWVETVIW
jgi:hypothetical protein